MQSSLFPKRIALLLALLLGAVMADETTLISNTSMQHEEHEQQMHRNLRHKKKKKAAPAPPPSPPPPAAAVKEEPAKEETPPAATEKAPSAQDAAPSNKEAPPAEAQAEPAPKTEFVEQVEVAKEHQPEAAPETPQETAPAVQETPAVEVTADAKAAPAMEADTKMEQAPEPEQEDTTNTEEDSVGLDADTSADVGTQQQQPAVNEEEETVAPGKRTTLHAPSLARLGSNLEKIQDATTAKLGNTWDSIQTSTSSNLQALQNRTTASLPSLQMPDLDLDAAKLASTTCQRIDHSIRYITSLDYTKLTNMSKTGDSKAEHVDVMMLQVLLLPLSLGLLLAGATLLWPVCVLTAACLGVFSVFHVLDHWIQAHPYFLEWWDCPMKLSGSVVAAVIAATVATSFMKFGIFSLGAVAAGSLCYFLLDSFPELDVGSAAYHAANSVGVGTVDSELSPVGWAMTCVAGALGGLFLRWWEEATLEAMTSIMGGIGISYSIHTFFALYCGTNLNRAIIFLIAALAAIAGCRFQRKRRLLKHYKFAGYEEIARSPSRDAGSSSSASSPSSPNQWKGLEQSLMLAASAASSPNSNNPNAPSAEQISDLTTAINALVEKMGATPTKKSEDKDE